MGPPYKLLSGPNSQNPQVSMLAGVVPPITQRHAQSKKCESTNSVPSKLQKAL